MKKRRILFFIVAVLVFTATAAEAVFMPEVFVAEESTPLQDNTMEKLSVEELSETIAQNYEYVDLSDSVQQQICEEYRISEEVLMEVQSSELSISLPDDIEVGKIIQTAGLSLEQFEQMLEAHGGDLEEAKKQCKIFGNFQYVYSDELVTKNPDCIELLLQGYSAYDIAKVAAISWFAGSTVSEMSALGEEQEFGDDVLSDVASIYNVKRSILEDAAASKSMTDDEFVDAMAEKIGHVLMADPEGISLYLAGGYDGGFDPESFPVAPYTYSTRGTEVLNQETGSVGYRETDAVIPGKNGLDLTIGVNYCSAEATEGDITSFVTNWGVTHSYDIDVPRQMFSPLVYFSAGWAFNFSYVRYFKESFDDIYPGVVTQNDGMCYSFDMSALKNAKLEEIPVRHWAANLKNIRVFKDTSYTANGVTSKFCVWYKDGNKEYFDGQGKLMKTVNKFGDEILYKYIQTGTEYTEREERKQHYNKVEITDTCNRLIIIERGAMTTNDDGEKHQIITVTMPDGSSVLYDARLSYNPHTINPEKFTTQVLISKTNQEGLTTRFEYIEDDVSQYTFQDGFVDKSKRAFYPMTRIIHPTGAITEYTYEHFLYGWLYKSSGGLEYYRLINRKDIADGKEYNFESWSYRGDYTDPTVDNSTFVTNSDGIITEYHYTCLEWLNPQAIMAKAYERIYYIKDDGTEVNLRKTEYPAYYKCTYPTKIVNYIYDESGNSVTVTENFEYNIYGDCIKYWDKRAGGNIKNNEYLTTFSYDETYHQLIEKTYKRDANTTIKEKNTLSDDKKVVLAKEIFMNDALVSKETYTYGDDTNLPSSVASYLSTASGDVRTTYYTYYNQALVTAQTVGNSTKTYTYDNIGRQISETDPNGNTKYMQYDNLGRPTSVVYPDNTEVVTYYQPADASGNVVNKVTQTAQNGNQTEYTYDKLGRISKVYDVASEANLAVYTYDSMGRVISVTDNDGNKTQYTYDKLGRQTSLSVKNSGNIEEYVETTEYTDVFNADTSKVTTKIGNGGNVIKNAVYTDKYGNIIKEDAGDSNETLSPKRYTYDYLGNKTAELFKTSATAGDSNRYTYITEAMANQGTRATIKDYYNNESSIQYNMQGQEKIKTDGNGNTVTTTYDSNGRVSTVSTPMDGGISVKSYTYDNNGNVTKESITSNKPGEAAQIRSTYYTYDEMNRVARAWSDEEGAVEYEYDSLGNVVRMTTGLTDAYTVGASTVYEYDARGRLIKTTDPNGNSETYTYDTRNNIIGMTDKNGAVTVNTYNAVNNILSSSVSSGGNTDTITYSYFKNALINNMSNSEGSISYAYNAKGFLSRITENRNTADYLLDYGYDVYNNRNSVILTKDGQRVNYQVNVYNYIGQLTQVSDMTQNKTVSSYTYDGAGNVKTAVLGNGTSTAYSYNSANMIKSVTNKKGSSVLSSYNYNYYLDGNRESVSDNMGRKQSFTYDGAGRLSTENDTANSSVITRSYTYDSRGNRLSMISNGVITNYVYDQNNRLLSQSCTDGTDASYTYDNNGNILSKTIGKAASDSNEPMALGLGIVGYSADDTTDASSVELYTYNMRNQLIGYQNIGTDVQYAYSADGSRISKTINGAVAEQVWNDAQVIYEAGDKNQRYIYGLNRIGMFGDENYYYHYNGHGDTTALTNLSGIAVKDYTYDAFGNQTQDGENDPNPFRYCGEYFDDETGLIYLRNRYYDPSIGRFLTEDPAKDGLNWYAYCGNNPVMFVDPSGLLGTGLTLKDRLLYAKTHPDEVEQLRVNDPDNFNESLSQATEKWIEEEIGENSISVKEYGDDIIIFAYFKVSGNGAKTNIGDDIYGDLAIYGIKQGWSATSALDNKNVHIITRDLSQTHTSHSAINIDIVQGLGISNTNAAGNITMYFGDIRTDYTYTAQDFYFTAAHEFGHSLGIKDAYNDKLLGHPIKSIMNSQWEVQGKAQPIDYDIMIRAQHTKKIQLYSGNPYLLKKYGY